MYGRLTLMTVRPGERAKMEALAEDLLRLYRQLPRFEGATFFADEQEGLYGALRLWASREDAEAAAPAAGPALREQLADVGCKESRGARRSWSTSPRARSVSAMD